MQGIARRRFDGDERVRFVTGDGGRRLEEYGGAPFDLVCADTWPGKFTHLDRMRRISPARPATSCGRGRRAGGDRAR